MKYVRPLLAATLVVFAATASFAGISVVNPAGASPQTTTTQSVPVTLTIPAAIGIDVESTAVAFDFSTGYGSPTSASLCGNLTTGATVFPPPGGCATTTYDAAVTSAGPTPTATDVWMSIFSSKDLGAGNYNMMDVKASVDEWTEGANAPGFDPALINYVAGTQNSTVNSARFGAVGTASPFVKSTLTSIKTAAMAASSVFGWTRIDQKIVLRVPAGTTFKEGTYHTALNFTLGY